MVQLLLYRFLSASRLCVAGPSFLQPPEQQPGTQPQQCVCRLSRLSPVMSCLPCHDAMVTLPYHSRTRSDRPCSSCMLSWTTDNVVA